MHSGVYIPALAQLLSLSGQAPDGVDPNGPLAEFQMELSDISDAPIDDSVFAIPSDYQAAQLEKLIGDYNRLTASPGFQQGGQGGEGGRGVGVEEGGLGQ